MKLFKPKCKNCKKPLQEKDYFYGKKVICKDCYEEIALIIGKLEGYANEMRSGLKE